MSWQRCAPALPVPADLRCACRLCPNQLWPDPPVREEDAAEVHGHITSLAVARTHRKLGLATRLMMAARAAPLCAPFPAGFL